jgi:hypothetical protein
MLRIQMDRRRWLGEHFLLQPGWSHDVLGPECCESVLPVFRMEDLHLCCVELMELNKRRAGFRFRLELSHMFCDPAKAAALKPPVAPVCMIG